MARFAYHWVLVQWQNQYEQDKHDRDECLKLGLLIDENKLNKPSQGSLRKQT